MYLIELKSFDPFFNLAAEEYLFRQREEDYLLIYRNERAVITGKHQVAHKEINTKFAFENSIPLLRRISGGGTVYHDPGNLNFSFIVNSPWGKQVDFRKHTLPLINFLDTLGVKACLEGKSDLKINGMKISGNAAHVFKNRVLHHGTLLFMADLHMLKNVLRNDTSAYLTRAINSNPSPVVNLKTVIHNTDHASIGEFSSGLKQWFLENQPGIKEYFFDNVETDIIDSLSKSKYRTWEWNYAYGPEYQFSRIFKISGQNVSCLLNVKDGIISRVETSGTGLFAEIIEQLTGLRHMPEDLIALFRQERFVESEIDVFDFF